MKKLMFVVLSLVVVAAQAKVEPAQRERGLNFNAPTVNDVANVSNPQMGEIVFDTSDNSFYGNTDGTGSGWAPLSAPPGSAAVVSNGNERIERALISITGASTCSIGGQSGTWVSSPTASGSVCTLTMSGFSAAPTCVVTRYTGTPTDATVGCIASSATTLSCWLYDISGGGATTGSLNLLCMGPR